MQQALSRSRSLSAAGKLTVAGLVVAAAGIVIQIARGRRVPHGPPRADHLAGGRGPGRPGRPLAVDTAGRCGRGAVPARRRRARPPGQGAAGRSECGRHLCRHGDPTAGPGRRAHRRRGRHQAELSNPTFQPWLTQRPHLKVLHQHIPALAEDGSSTSGRPLQRSRTSYARPGKEVVMAQHRDAQRCRPDRIRRSSAWSGWSAPGTRRVERWTPSSHRMEQSCERSSTQRSFPSIASSATGSARDRRRGALAVVGRRRRPGAAQSARGDQAIATPGIAVVRAETRRQDTTSRPHAPTATHPEERNQRCC